MSVFAVINTSHHSPYMAGLLYTEEPVVRSFKQGGSLELNANISDSNYGVCSSSSLAWYHNGTELSSGSKYSISNNATTLRISNMNGSDAGIYVVKIASIDRHGARSDSRILPLLESIALHAPVTFTVQENDVPVYDPSSIVSTVYVSENSSYIIELTKPVQLSYPQRDVYSVLYRNGTQILSTYYAEWSGQITYSSSAVVLGDYMGVLILSDRSIFIDDSLCVYDTLRNLTKYYYEIPVKELFWSVSESIAIQCHAMSVIILFRTGISAPAF